MTAALVQRLMAENQRELRRRAHLAREFGQIRDLVERLAARVEGIAATDALIRYQPPPRPDGSRYDAAAAGERLAATVRRRIGLVR